MRKAFPTLILGLAFSSLAPSLWGDDPQVPDSRKHVAGSKPDRRLEDPPTIFLPLVPRSVEDQKRVDSLRMYAAARALEDRHQLGEAISVLEKARVLTPDSTSILGRLSRLNLVLGRTDAAVASARRLIEIDPSDPTALSLLVAHYLERKNDPAAAEAILKKIASNPELDKKSPGYCLVLRIQGDLYADLLNRPKDAADAYAKLIDVLDDRAANRLTPRDRARILDGDEASTYVKIGTLFQADKRYGLAVRAFRRGLVYKPEHATLPRLLAEALAYDGDAKSALSILEPYLARMPAGSESYEQLTKLLDSMGRRRDVLPRLEAAAKADPKNLRLQFFLAERYRAEGQNANADALLVELLKNQGDPQVYAALAESYVREKKCEELVRILGEAAERRGGAEALMPTLVSLSGDPATAGLVLDAGARMMAANPPSLAPKAREMLTVVATRGKLFDRLIAIDRAALKAAPNAVNLKTLAQDLMLATDFAAASDVLAELIEKFPHEKNGPTLVLLAKTRFRAGKIEPALETARAARDLAPNDPDGLLFLAFLLGQVGRDDDAIGVYEDMLKRFPGFDEITKLCRSGLSGCYVNKGDIARGEAELEILFRQHPDDPTVNNDLGYLYADQGKNLEKAEAMIRKAIEDEPENSSFLDSLGWVLYKRGKLRDAIEPLEKAAKSGTTDVTICEHLGDVFFRLKDYPRARESWTKAEAIAGKSKPPGKRFAEIRKKLAELQKIDPANKSPSGDGP